jgi:hypothetical protein
VSKRLTVLVAVIAGVLAGAVVGGSALVGATAQSESSGDSTTTVERPTRQTEPTQPTHPCGGLLSMLPTELRTDLEAVRALPEGERREALRAILDSARAGKYGEQVEQFADSWKDHRRELWQKLPADLRSDLAELRGMTPEQRRDALAELRKDALAGEYGDQVEQFAERLQERREKCAP